MSQQYIKNSSKQFKESFHEKDLGNIKVYVKDDLPKDFNLNLALQKVEDLVNNKLFSTVDYIMIGQFDFIESRDLNAAYHNGTIYVTNEQDDEDDFVDDIVHEIAHAVEVEYDQLIYEDGDLKSEFLIKRQMLHSRMDSELESNLGLQHYMKTEYDVNFDNFLYYDVGYTFLRPLTFDLFYSPYGITSLNEYFANGFEAFYFHKDFKRLKSISPTLYNKIITIDNEVKNEI